jgi:transposase
VTAAAPERVTAAAPERIPASVRLRELHERGYVGGYRMLKLFAAGLKPNETATPVVRLMSLPITAAVNVPGRPR